MLLALLPLDCTVHSAGLLYRARVATCVQCQALSSCTMFGPKGPLLRGLRSAWSSRGWHWGSNNNTEHRHPGGSPFRLHNVAAAASSGMVQSLGNSPKVGLKLATVLMGSGAAVAWNAQSKQPEFGSELETSELVWVQELSGKAGMREVHIPGQQLRRHPVGQLIAEDDHLFERMRQNQQIKEFRCFYDPREQRFHSVVLLGKEVCGYPSTVHGGLTAAIIDESLGGLYTSLLTTGKLGWTLPGLTARLEVDYKKPVPPGTTLLCTTEVESIEPRKVWMRATVSNGNGTTYASGRALFVSPNVGKHFRNLWASNKAGEAMSKASA